ncbi:hypothetical protein [Nocardia donostiensis]|uniref:ESX-1 secretion-associated protein n=1 Tax=Nocardia donostiensis TaxID=1538463 RepID=A0A1W0AW79_9NOCA|nr:hypothetical protein [Nocardia donostiensis]ONM48271.1 hypothetical protein B0T46_12840 [Nocardia donostiensis]OQS14533.1 hypothetical protein B0T36_13495 [Nocardia donostiensis]OQS20619.1 hypothetical protein B0T44_10140 [Nocardia donostiensis]
MTTGVQTGELGKLGNELNSSASVVKDQAEKVSNNMVGPGEVGANYSEQGKKIQTGLEAVRAWLEDWAEATTNTGHAVGASEVIYSNVDQENATNTTNAGS